MSQTTAELTKNTPNEAIKEAEEITKKEGELSIGENDKDLTNNGAVAEVVKGDELKIDGISAAENTLEAAAEPSGEAAPLEVDPGLQAVGVVVHDEALNSEHASGSEVPAGNLGKAVIDINPTPAEKPIKSSDPFNAMASGRFAGGDPEVYQEALIKKWARMLYAKIPKILGGTTQAAPEPQKALQPKTT